MTLLQRWSTIVSAAIFAMLCAVSTHAILGQPGTLDSTFGTGGVAVTPVGSGSDLVRAAALQPDGKLLLAGFCYVGGSPRFCALRYNTNGSLDTTFGSGGTVVTSVGGIDDSAKALALQRDGRIVLAGYCYVGANAKFCVLRYNADGTLDSSFGNGGSVITPVDSGFDSANGLVLQPDAKLVLAGTCSGNTCAVRYNADGTLDGSFGTGGIVVTPAANGVSAQAIVLQPDGKVVLAGYCNVGNSSDFCALRYNANGTLDIGFGSGGRAITPIGSDVDNAQAIAIQPDGKLVLAGLCTGASVFDYDFCALRYNKDGTLDSTFGNGGRVITPVGTQVEHAQAISMQPDGKVVVAGFCDVGIDNNICAIRYTPTGGLDPTFGSGGKVITSLGSGYHAANSIVLQPDGKLVLAGTCQAPGKYNFCALRYDGGPFGYKACTPDLDGDGSFLATTDALINMRIALGITGPAVVNGITFPPTATRNTWPLIRDYLVTQCGMSLVP